MVELKRLFIINKRSVLSEYLEKSNIEDIAEEIMPASNFTLHLEKNQRKNNSYALSVISHFAYLFALFFFEIKSSFLFLFQKLPTADYFLLIYVPNIKYEKYLYSLIDTIDKKYLIISNDPLSIKSTNIRMYSDFRILVQLLKFQFNFILYSFHFVLFDKNRFIKIAKNRFKIYKLVRFNYIFEKLFTKTTIVNYLSFVPSIDQHQIIYKLFHSCFKTGYAIRPDATTISPEHSTISCDVLFYKSDFEKEYYKKSGLSEAIKLVKAGILVEHSKLLKEEVSKIDRIIIYDTNISKDTLRTKSRRQFLMDSLNKLIPLSQFEIFIKLHPGLPANEVSEIKKQYKNSFIRFIEKKNSSYLNEPHCAISFYSTVLQNLILNKYPVVLISDYYDNESMTDNNELVLSPIVVVKNGIDYDKIISDILKNNFKDLCTQELFMWYKDLYNYPEGMKVVLNSINMDIT